MSIFFDQDVGVIQLSVKDIVEKKKQWLLETYGMNFDDEANIYHIIASSLSLIEKDILDELHSFFQTTRVKDGDFWKEIQNYIKIYSTTFEAVRDRILAVNGVKYVNIKSTAGKVQIFLILESEFLKSSNQKQLIDDNESLSKLKKQLWQAIYDSAPVGTHYDGSIELDGTNEHGQKLTYKVDLGEVKYLYLNVKYKIDLKNHIHLNIDAQIRKIYERIITNNYGAMGLKFEYMDFLAPVNEVKGINFMEINACTKTDTNTLAKDLTSSDWQKNPEISISESEFLDISASPERLIIDIQT